MAWRNYVHEECANEQNEAVRRRRRHLVLDLSEKTEPVPISKLATLSPRVAQDYAKKSPKTLTRDIDALVEEKLLVKTHAGVAANRGLILAFLPRRRMGLGEEG